MTAVEPVYRICNGPEFPASYFAARDYPLDEWLRIGRARLVPPRTPPPPPEPDLLGALWATPRSESSPDSWGEWTRSAVFDTSTAELAALDRIDDEYPSGRRSRSMSTIMVCRLLWRYVDSPPEPPHVIAHVGRVRRRRDLPTGLLAALDARAARWGVSRVLLIRDALRYLATPVVDLPATERSESPPDRWGPWTPNVMFDLAPAQRDWCADRDGYPEIRATVTAGDVKLNESTIIICRRLWRYVESPVAIPADVSPRGRIKTARSLPRDLVAALDTRAARFRLTRRPLIRDALQHLPDAAG